MDLETAVFRIAARQAAKLEAQGLRVPLEPDALKNSRKITRNSSSVALSKPPAINSVNPCQSGPTTGAARAAI